MRIAQAASYFVGFMLDALSTHGLRKAVAMMPADRKLAGRCESSLTEARVGGKVTRAVVLIGTCDLWWTGLCTLL